MRSKVSRRRLTVEPGPAIALLSLPATIARRASIRPVYSGRISSRSAHLHGDQSRLRVQRPQRPRRSPMRRRADHAGSAGGLENPTAMTSHPSLVRKLFMSRLHWQTEGDVPVLSFSSSRRFLAFQALSVSRQRTPWRRHTDQLSAQETGLRGRCSSRLTPHHAASSVRPQSATDSAPQKQQRVTVRMVRPSRLR